MRTRKTSFVDSSDDALASDEELKTYMATHQIETGKNVNGPDKNCTVLPNAYGCHLNSRIIRSFISV
ncbi:hypothetical protein Lpp120_1579 [Lacticaseibacillus paracasei subsp. paracasei Lpp120]|uniref:Uncharacterized protein n=1 Tax=Lacticaseibacillus paracasei subsp. paracasei Lpp71 TaxID=1256207 RepID=A0A8E0IR86_LACPA|nr:hypothetical protein Lpp120_1579 [Lacticaseibacillus paracasei subsp. paracasei Lpp120]EPC72129.1 hypothetical protein Lpp71_11550 [Lacticaseibacillus paracasei subsp. paracasei Lpp71]EPD09919.1 hypothetical protein Lpp48_12851 [Lacticaseibacillus paracasei subsp. paracasei Lpp48]